MSNVAPRITYRHHARRTTLWYARRSLVPWRGDNQVNSRNLMFFLKNAIRWIVAEKRLEKEPDRSTFERAVLMSAEAALLLKVPGSALTFSFFFRSKSVRNPN